MTRSRLSIDLLSQECDLPFKGAVKMYPILRMAKELIKTSLASKLKVTDVHVSHHICWPWDLDTFAELNNGRTIVAGNRNVAIFLIAASASQSEEFLIFLGCYQFPMYLTPVLMRPVSGKNPLGETN